MVEEKSQSEVIKENEIERLNDLMKDYPYKLGVVNVNSLEFLDKNARYMTSEMFRNLVENIKKDGGLSSVPLCWKHGNRYRVLSGNHRCQAAIEAGMQQVLILYTDKDLTKQEQIAIQLSHNAIDGKDDMAILKDLWDEIDDVSLKYYAGLDDKTLDEMEKATLASLSEVKLDYRSVTFLFLPHEVERLNEAFAHAIEHGGVQDTVYVNRIEDFKRLLEAQSKVQRSYDVKNSATSLMLILDMFYEHEDELTNGYINNSGELIHKGDVPISSVLGKDYIPAETAQILKRAVDRMVDSGEIKAKNKLEFLRIAAERYLNGDVYGRKGEVSRMDRGKGS